MNGLSLKSFLVQLAALAAKSTFLFFSQHWSQPIHLDIDTPPHHSIGSANTQVAFLSLTIVSPVATSTVPNIHSTFSLLNGRMN